MPLSKELIVACEIYHFNFHREHIWLSKLCESLKVHMDAKDVSASLDTLFDWIIIQGHCGETEKGRAGYLLEICEDEKEIIKMLYERYWAGVR